VSVAHAEPLEDALAQEIIHGHAGNLLDECRHEVS